MQPLFPAALVLAHWIPWFSNSYLNSMKLYHEEFHSALNLPMKSNLVHVLQRWKSKPIIFLLIAECRQGFRSTKVPVQKSRKHNQSEDCTWTDAQYFGSEESACTWFYKCNFLDAKAVQVVWNFKELFWHKLKLLSSNLDIQHLLTHYSLAVKNNFIPLQLMFLPIVILDTISFWSLRSSVMINNFPK